MKFIIGVATASAFATAVSAEAPRALSFEERVRAQEALERVHYGHQIGATKPFASAAPGASIEGKTVPRTISWSSR